MASSSSSSSSLPYIPPIEGITIARKGKRDKKNLKSLRSIQTEMITYLGAQNKSQNEQLTKMVTILTTLQNDYKQDSHITELGQLIITFHKTKDTEMARLIEKLRLLETKLSEQENALIDIKILYFNIINSYFMYIDLVSSGSAEIKVGDSKPRTANSNLKEQIKKDKKVLKNLRILQSDMVLFVEKQTRFQNDQIAKMSELISNLKANHEGENRITELSKLVTILDKAKEVESSRVNEKLRILESKLSEQEDVLFTIKSQYSNIVKSYFNHAAASSMGNPEIEMDGPILIPSTFRT